VPDVSPVIAVSHVPHIKGSVNSAASGLTVVSVSESKTELKFNVLNSSDIVITGRVKISREELLKVDGGKKYTPCSTHRSF